jgi:hypothetical protein
MTTQTETLHRTEASRVAAKKKAGRPKAKSPKRALYVEIAAPLRAALDKAVRQERRDLTTVVSMALEDFLSVRQLWPPADAPSED